MDTLCNNLKIHHQLIRPRTPRHNGKVERSHRFDNERFYRYLKFYSYNDLIIQMKRYLYRSNNIHTQSLNWLSPIKTKNYKLFLINNFILSYRLFYFYLFSLISFNYTFVFLCFLFLRQKVKLIVLFQL